MYAKNRQPFRLGHGVKNLGIWKGRRCMLASVPWRWNIVSQGRRWSGRGILFSANIGLLDHTMLSSFVWCVYASQIFGEPMLSLQIPIYWSSSWTWKTSLFLIKSLFVLLFCLVSSNTNHNTIHWSIYHYMWGWKTGRWLLTFILHSDLWF